MSMLLATLAASLPSVGFAVLARLTTTEFMQAVLEKIIVAALSRVAQYSTNTVDDELVELVKKQFTGGEK